MLNPLIMKLEQFARFSAEERRRLDEITAIRRKTVAARHDIISDGADAKEIHVVLSGMAARYKDLPDGERQIMAFLIPGDLCDIEVFVLEEMDHGITALTETVCAVIPADTMRALLTEQQCLTQALWWSTMTDSAVLRERIIDLGRRDAHERVAHLFYELLIRYRMVGLTRDNAYPLPLTQQELSEATGLTSVHVNRVMRQLREEGLIEHRGKVLTVKDPAGLKKAGRFSSRYLHLRRAEAGDEKVMARVGDLV